MSNVIIYLRFSTPKQEQGDSIERQRRVCQAEAAAKGWTVVGELSDTGRSAYKGDHLSKGELGALAERIRAGQVPPGTILLVEKLDRLSRLNPSETYRWVLDMTDRGLRIASVAGNLLWDKASLSNPSNIMQIMQLLWEAYSAHSYSATLSQRVASACEKRRRAAIERNEIYTARCPAWLRMTADRRFEVLPERAAIVVRIYELARDGFGKTAIARQLNELGIAPWGTASRGSRAPGWEPSYINLILHSPAVEGDFVPLRKAGQAREETGERAVGYFPRVVDAALVADARHAMAARRGTGGRKGRAVANLFSGLIECAECGGPLIMRHKSNASGGYRYLQCANGSLKRGCTQGGFYHYGRFEAAALDDILRLALNDDHFARPELIIKAAGALAEARKRLEDLKATATRLAQAMARFGIDEAPEVEAEYRATRQRIEAAEIDVEAAERAYEVAKGSVNDAEHLRRVDDVRALLDNTNNTPERFAARVKVQAALRAVVTRGVADPADRSITLTLAEGLHTLTIDKMGKVVSWEAVATDGEGESAVQRAYMDRRRALPETDLLHPLPRDLLSSH